MKAHRYEAALHAKMLLADYLEFVGRQLEAVELAKEVKAKAEALNYAIPLGRALDHLAGKGPLGASNAVLAPKFHEEKIVSNANMSDETLYAYAALMCFCKNLKMCPHSLRRSINYSASVSKDRAIFNGPRRWEIRLRERCIFHYQGHS